MSKIIQEIKARSGKIIMIIDKKGSKKAKKYCDKVVILPETNILTTPYIFFACTANSLLFGCFAWHGCRST